MNTLAGAGISHHRNPRVAAREAVMQALEKAGIEGRPDFVLMFASVGYDQKLLVTTVRELTDGAPLAGCSGEGIITQGEANEGNFTVALMVVHSAEVRFHHARAGNMKAAPFDNGRAIAESLREHAGGDIIGMVLLADGIGFNFDKFTNGFRQHFGTRREVLLFGGMAADNWAMKQTYQYYDDQIFSDGAVAVLMTGSLRVAHAVNHGCMAIGNERTVTRCKDNIIYEIDHKPVLEILKEYLLEDEVDNWTKTVVNLSWGFKATNDIKDEYDELMIRFMPAKDDEAGSITIPTEVQEGTKVWMTRRDHDKIGKGVGRIGEQIKQKLDGNVPKLVLHFDCAGRGKMVFREQRKLGMLRSLQQELGPEVPWLGFYTYGEIGPVGTCNCFHNYTLSLMALY